MLAITWTEFQAFTMLHAAASITCGVAMGVAAWLGLRWSDAKPRHEKALRHTWAWFIVAFQLFSIVWYAWPSRFDHGVSYPLHMCDLAAWLAPVALLTRLRWSYVLLYFWGVGLSTQAFFTPVLEHGPATTRFWLFWISHTQIVGSGVYVVVALGYRPTLRDLRFAFVGALLYAAAVMPVNLLLDVNYGYIGRSTPGVRTIVDALGPWPWRVGLMALLVLVMFTIAWAPWEVVRRVRGPAPSPLGGEGRGEGPHGVRAPGEEAEED